jgi:hypothetical protein
MGAIPAGVFTILTDISIPSTGGCAASTMTVSNDLFSTNPDLPAEVLSYPRKWFQCNLSHISRCNWLPPTSSAKRPSHRPSIPSNLSKPPCFKSRSLFWYVVVLLLAMPCHLIPAAFLGRDWID